MLGILVNIVVDCEHDSSEQERIGTAQLTIIYAALKLQTMYVVHIFCCFELTQRYLAWRATQKWRSDLHRKNAFFVYKFGALLMASLNLKQFIEKTCMMQFSVQGVK